MPRLGLLLHPLVPFSAAPILCCSTSAVLVLCVLGLASLNSTVAVLRCSLAVLLSLCCSRRAALARLILHARCAALARLDLSASTGVFANPPPFGLPAGVGSHKRLPNDNGVKTKQALRMLHPTGLVAPALWELPVRDD